MSLEVEILTFNQAGKTICSNNCSEDLDNLKLKENLKLKNLARVKQGVYPDIVVIGLQESNNSIKEDKLIEGILNEYNKNKPEKYVLLKAHRAGYGLKGFIANRLGVLIKKELIDQKLINQELINQELNLTREDIKSYCTKTNYYNEKSEKVKYNNATFICEQKFFNKGTKTFIMLFLKIKKGEYEYELCFVTTHLPFNKDETKTLQGFDKRIKQLIKIKECFNEFKNKLNMDNPVLFIMGDLNFRCNFNQLYFNEKFNEKLQVNKLNNLQNILNGNETKFLDKYKKFSEYHFLNGKFEIDDTNNYYNQIKRNINKLRNNKLQYIDELKKYDELTIFLKICKRLNQTNIKSISNNRLIDYIAGSINILNNAQKLFIFFTFLRFLKKGNDDLDFFSKFAEGKDDKGPEFEPTCKYENERLIYKGTNDKYPRLPSWYDRILYKKSDKYSIYCTEYKSKGGNTKSDHKWVMGEYIITNKY